MATKDPDQIRAEIEQTRSSLGRDTDRLEEKVNPQKVVERRVDGVKQSVSDVRDRVFGSPDDPTDSGALPSGGDAVQRVKGTPVLAGAVAFGLGYLVASLLPGSRKEEQLAHQAKDQAMQYKEPVTDALKDAANEIKDEVQPQAQQAVSAVKEAGQDAADTVKDSATSAASDVQGTAQDAAGTVKDQAQSSAESVKADATS